MSLASLLAAVLLPTYGPAEVAGPSGALVPRSSLYTPAVGPLLPSANPAQLARTYKRAVGCEPTPAAARDCAAAFLRIAQRERPGSYARALYVSRCRAWLRVARSISHPER